MFLQDFCKRVFPKCALMAIEELWQSRGVRVGFSKPWRFVNVSPHYSTTVNHSICIRTIGSKVSFFVQCIKKQLIIFQNFNIQTCFSQFKGQMISRIHLILHNAYKLVCFDRNINANRDVKFLECDYLLVQQCMKLTLDKKDFRVHLHFPGRCKNSRNNKFA